MSAAPLKTTSERTTDPRPSDPSALTLSPARQELVVPDGFRSVAHLLDTVAEAAGRVFGGQADLARYLGTNTKSVSRWLRKRKYPRQATLDAMAQWYVRARK